MANVGMSAAGGAAGGASVGSAAGPYGALIGAVIGAGLGVFGALKSASDEADAERAKADDQKRQAEEIAQREEWNDIVRAEQTYKAGLDFGAQAAGSGHGGSGVGSQLEIKRQGDLATAFADREAAFQEDMLLRGVSMTYNSANQTQQAGYINAASGIVGAAGKYYGDPANRPNSSTQDRLPAPGSQFSNIQSTDSSYTMPVLGQSSGYGSNPYPGAHL